MSKHFSVAMPKLPDDDVFLDLTGPFVLALPESRSPIGSRSSTGTRRGRRLRGPDPRRHALSASTLTILTEA
jgi:hypothetical protein